MCLIILVVLFVRVLAIGVELAIHSYSNNAITYMCELSSYFNKF